MAEKEKYIGEARLIDKIKSKLNLIIKPGAITTTKIADKAVTAEKVDDDAITGDKIRDAEIAWKKLNPDLQNIIASREEGGVALSNEFGDSTLIGITQQKLTSTISALNRVSFTSSVPAVLSDILTPVIIRIEFVIPTNFTLYKGTEVMASGIGSLGIAVNDQVTVIAGEEVVYTLNYHIEGLEEDSIDLTIPAVYPIFYGYGSGSIFDSHSQVQEAKLSPEGTYTISEQSEGDHIIFAVPPTMTIEKATMEGLDFPLDDVYHVPPEYEIIPGVEYNYYKSSNTYAAGEVLTIEIK